MHPVHLLIPVISAVAFWLMIRLFIRHFFRPAGIVKILGSSVQGIIPENKKKIAVVVAAAVNKELMNPATIHKILARPETLQKAMPEIDVHIDHFINVKLKESLPVISMFIGESVTKQLKDLFMKELEALFPSVMSQFIDGLGQSNEIEHEIETKILSIPTAAIEATFYRIFKKELIKVELGFAAAGFVTGILQLLILLLAA